MATKSKPFFIIRAYEDQNENAYSKVSTLSRDFTSNKSNGITNIDGAKRNVKSPNQPPPPPPMPVIDKTLKLNGSTNKPIIVHSKTKAPPPPPPLKKFLQNNNHSNNNHINGNHINGVHEKSSEKPITPLPDYDTSVIKVKKPTPPKLKADTVEMESLESFKLNHPSSPPPKPPSTYFMKQPYETLTMKKASQQVSVTIGEYPTNTFRKQPAKLDFLNGDTVDGNHNNNESVGSRLQSELTQMLSRSNLKKKTESDKLVNGDNQINSSENPLNFESNEINAHFNKRYGHLIMPQPPLISIPKVPITKSLSHNVTLNGTNDINKTLPQVYNKKLELTKTESLPQNGGILKNSTPLFISNTIKANTQQKSIKFGQTTTVIGEPNTPLIINN